MSIDKQIKHMCDH